ncbi:MAG: flagellar biosynthesis protein FlhB [Firmicutes bacterium HGW-Firmicutes-13]|nr:MAG: flagellar biosynthesis protein FlhB [Firmicutes bacterium HGW-Firmicutes-13]
MGEIKLDKKKLRQAAALKYDKVKHNAPVITALGKGYAAEKIIELARENDIPVKEDSFLAETLSLMDIGQEITPELYEAVALLLSHVMKKDEMLD